VALRHIRSQLVSEAGQCRLLALGTVALAVTSVYLARIPPATGYETSLVEAYPPLFWLSFTVGLTVVIVVFVLSSLVESPHWAPAFGLLAAFYAIFFFLPLHRGYRLYGRASTDGLAHLGIVKEAIATGSLEVFYPVEHLLIAELSALGVPFRVARYLLPYVLTLLFIAGMGVLIRALTADEHALGAGFCAATPLVFTYHQIQINPFLLSFLLFPLVVFLFERTRATSDWRHRISYVLVGIGIVFFHPMTAVFLLILVVSTLVFQRGYSWYSGGGLPVLRTYIASLTAVVFVWWYSTFERTELAVSLVASSLSGGGEEIVSQQSEQIQAVQFSLLEIAQRAVIKYGIVFLVLGVAGLYVLVIVSRVYWHRQQYPETYATVQYAVGGALAVLFLLVDLIARDPIRVSRYFVLGGVMLVGLLLFRLSSDLRGSSRSSSGRPLILVAVVLCVLAAAVLGTYAGSTYWPNKHMTHAEYEGSEFLLSHNDPEVQVYGQSLHPKMQTFVTGNRSIAGHPPAFRRGPEYSVPRHLGYDTNETVAQTFGRSYLVTQDYDVEFPRASYYTPEQQSYLFVYDETILRRLQNDSTAGRVYTNGGFTLWNVSPDREVTDP